MHPPPRVRLSFNLSPLLMLRGGGSQNAGPGVRDLCLGTVSACSMQDNFYSTQIRTTDNKMWGDIECIIWECNLRARECAPVSL